MPSGWTANPRVSWSRGMKESSGHGCRTKGSNCTRHMCSPVRYSHDATLLSMAVSSSSILASVGCAVSFLPCFKILECSRGVYLSIYIDQGSLNPQKVPVFLVSPHCPNVRNSITSHNPFNLPCFKAHIPVWQNVTCIWFRVVLRPNKAPSTLQSLEHFSRGLWRRTRDPDWRVIQFGDHAPCLDLLTVDFIVLGLHCELIPLFTMAPLAYVHQLVLISALSHEVYIFLLRFDVELTHDNLPGTLGKPLDVYPGRHHRIRPIISACHLCWALPKLGRFEITFRELSFLHDVFWLQSM